MTNSKDNKIVNKFNNDLKYVFVYELADGFYEFLGFDLDYGTDAIRVRHESGYEYIAEESFLKNKENKMHSLYINEDGSITSEMIERFKKIDALYEGYLKNDT